MRKILFILLMISSVAYSQSNNIHDFSPRVMHAGFGIDTANMVDTMYQIDDNSFAFEVDGITFKAYVNVNTDSTWVTVTAQTVTATDSFKIGDSTFVASDFDFTKILDTISPSLTQVTDTLVAGVDDTISNPFEDGVVPVALYVQDSSGQKIEGVIGIIQDNGDVILYSDQSYTNVRVTIFGSDYTGNALGIEYYGGDGISVDQNTNIITNTDHDSIAAHRADIDANADSITAHRNDIDANRAEYLDSLSDHRNDIDNNTDSIAAHRTDIDANRSEYLDSLSDHRNDINGNLNSIISVQNDVSSLDSSGLPWYINTAKYYDQYLDISKVITSFSFNKDGSKVYLQFSSGDSISQYSLVENWNITTASFDSSVVLDTISLTGQDLFISPKGDKLFLLDDIGATTKVKQFDIDTGNIFTISNMVESNLPNESAALSFFFKSDGSKMYVSHSDSIHTYSLNANWDISSFTKEDNSSFVGITNRSFFINSDGTKFYVLESNFSDVYYVKSYSLLSPWDISTASYDNYRVEPDVSTGAFDINFKPDGSFFYLNTSDGSRSIIQYNLAP